MKTVDLVQIRQGLQLGGDPGMHSNKLAIDNTTQGHVIEQRAEGLEYFLIIF